MSPPWPPLHPLSKAHHTLRRTNLFRRRRQQLLAPRTPSSNPVYIQQTSHVPLLTSAQSLTAMVRELRKGKSQTGLILANGGVLTYQHILCLSKQPRQDGTNYPLSNPLPRYITDLPIPSIAARAEGEAIIEVRSLFPSLFIQQAHTHTGTLTITHYRHTQLNSIATVLLPKASSWAD